MPWPDPEQATEDRTIPPKPGLGEKDRMILEAMIENGFIVPDKIWYNQTVGNVSQDLIDSMPPDRRDWIIATYSKRPDIMYEERGVLYAAEIKPYASYVALGQALMYRYHANRKADPPRLIIAVILTDLPDPDLIPVAADNGIEIRQLGVFTQFRPMFPT